MTEQEKEAIKELQALYHYNYINKNKKACKCLIRAFYILNKHLNGQIGWRIQFDGSHADELKDVMDEQNEILHCFHPYGDETEYGRAINALIKNAEENGVIFSKYDLGWVTAQKGKYIMTIDLFDEEKEIGKKLHRLIHREEKDKEKNPRQN